LNRFECLTLADVSQCRPLIRLLSEPADRWK
jgi:hypothetical protein